MAPIADVAASGTSSPDGRAYDIVTKVGEVITRVNELEDLTGVQATAIADLEAITGGQTPTEAEHNLVLEALNDVLAALRAAGIVASS